MLRSAHVMCPGAHSTRIGRSGENGCPALVISTRGRSFLFLSATQQAVSGYGGVRRWQQCPWNVYVQMAMSFKWKWLMLPINWVFKCKRSQFTSLNVNGGNPKCPSEFNWKPRSAFGPSPASTATLVDRAIKLAPELIKPYA